MSADLGIALLYAAKTLLRIESGHPLEVAMAQTLQDEHLRPAVQSMVYSSLRRYALCEAILKTFCSRVPATEVRCLLHVALAELLSPNTKPYALVNEATAQVKRIESLSHSAGFVNACLRRFCRERDVLVPDLMRYRDIALNVPSWLLNAYENSLGADQTTESLVLAQTKAPLVLRVNRRHHTPQSWCEFSRSLGLQARPIGIDGVILETAVPVAQIPGFAEGFVSVQDAGAQLAARFLAPKPGDRVLDACAAPGGKTAHLLETSDAQVTAFEIDSDRAKRLHETLNRVGLTANVVTADAATINPKHPEMRFDSVLLDAPCSASGILRRHPDIALLRRPEDVVSLAKQQKRLLEALWPTVKFGGKLLYVVCSVFKQEGTEQISGFLRRHHDAKPISLMPELGSSLLLAPSEHDRRAPGTIPEIHDGFFYAMLTKN